MPLTALAIKEAKPNGKRRWLHDREGLYLVIMPTGAKRWYYRGRVAGGDIKKVQLGEVSDALDLKAARHLASEARKAAHRGLTYEAKAEAEAKRGPTVAASWQTYIQSRDDWRESTAAEHQRIFASHIEPEIGSRPIAAVSKADVLPILDEATGRGPAARNKVTAVLTGFCNWAVEERDLIDRSPMRGLKQKRSRRRERTLDDSEIAKLWKACTALDADNETTVRFGAMFKLLLLTGARRSEVASAAYSEVKANKWTIPGERTKNGRPLTVYLGKAAKAIIESLPRFVDCDHLFGPTGATGSFGYSKAKQRIDKLAKLPPWTLHDLRRTARTGWSRLGVAQEICERMMNHVMPELVATYDQHLHEKPMAEAWLRWERHLLKIAR